MIVETYEENFDLNIKEINKKKLNDRKFNFNVKLVNQDDIIKTIVTQQFDDDQLKQVEKNDENELAKFDFNFIIQKLVDNNIESIKIIIKIIPDNLLKVFIKLEINNENDIFNELFGLSSTTSSILMKKFGINNVKKDYIITKNSYSIENKYSNEIKAGGYFEKEKIVKEITDIHKELDKIKEQIRKKKNLDLINETPYNNYYSLNDDVNNIISKPC